MAERALPSVVIRRNVRNQSSRNGVRPRLIVIHSTESHNRPGSGDLAAIGTWFDNPRAQASSHVCTDADGHSARYVGDRAKAWHVAGYNAVSLGIEQIGQASQGSWSEAEINETARWCALWSIRWGIPLTHGQVGSGMVVKAGIVTHASLGAMGGGHHDPGSAYPLSHMIRRARHYKRLRR